MRFPSTKQLTQTSESYNRKAFKKQLKKDLRTIRKELNRVSKTGSYVYNNTTKEHHLSFWRSWVLFRYLRRYTDLDVTIKENDVYHSKTGVKYVGRLHFNIKW